MDREKRYSPDRWGHLKEGDLVVKKTVECLAEHGFAVSISPVQDEGYWGEINASPSAKDVLRMIYSSLHFELLRSAINGDRDPQTFRDGLEHSEWQKSHRQKIEALYVYNNSIESGLSEENARAKANQIYGVFPEEFIRDHVVLMLVKEEVEREVERFYNAQQVLQTAGSSMAGSA